MNNLQSKDLIEDEVYWADTPQEYIFQAYNGGGFKAYIARNSVFEQYMYMFKTFQWTGNIRLATKQEKAWLLACIKANKLVPMPKNNNTPIVKLNITEE